MQIIRQETEYAIRALLSMIFLRGVSVPCGRIAEVCDIPSSFAYKVLHKLVEASLVRSDAGRGGGFQLARPPKKITLKQIVEAVQGPVEVRDCVLDPDACGRGEDCPLSGQWARLQASIASFLDGKTLYDVSQCFAHPAQGIRAESRCSESEED